MPEAIRQVEFILAHLPQECMNKVIQTLLIARVYSWSSPEYAAFIRLQKSTTAGQAAMLFTEYKETHHERQPKYWKKRDERRLDDGSEDMTPGMDMTSIEIGVEIENLRDDRIREEKNQRSSLDTHKFLMSGERA